MLADGRTGVGGEVLEAGRVRRRGGDDGLLAFKDGRTWRSLTAQHVNDYVKELLGEEFSAKDFRTWRGTVIAAHALADADGSTKTSRKRAAAAAMREVSKHLGNTPAVARSSYIDPRVLEQFEEGRTVLPTLRKLAGPMPDLTDDATRAQVERAVVRLIAS